MSKILALDPGDQWVGTAISDATRILARPLKTVPAENLNPFLHEIFGNESIDTIVIGYPKTMGGTISAQTQKVLNLHEALSKTYPDKTFVLWDERLSSKQAQSIKSARSKEEKLQSHSVAAALILDTYLRYLAFQAELAQETE